MFSAEPTILSPYLSFEPKETYNNEDAQWERQDPGTIKGI
jgi:hypothetical protein